VQSRYLKCSLSPSEVSIGQPRVSLVKLDAAPLRKLSCSLFQVNAYRFYFMVYRGPTHAKISVKLIGFCHQ